MLLSKMPERVFPFLLMALMGTCLVFVLSGCGFTPLYTRSLSAYPIKVATIPDREGQILKNELLALFPPSSVAKSAYRLEPRISFSQQEFGLRRDATAKRQTLTTTVSFQLIDELKDQILYQDTLTLSIGYNVGSSAEIAAVSLVTSEKDARMRLMQQAAQEIKILIESFLTKGSL